MSDFSDLLQSIRQRAIEHGMPLLTEDEILELIKRRRSGEEKIDDDSYNIESSSE